MQPNGTISSVKTGGSAVDMAWFCLRTHPKHEQLAAKCLRQQVGIEVLNPRVRFARPTRHGRIQITESLFPNYLFARFNWRTDLNRIHYSPGVSAIVHFGDQWPTIPDVVIEELRHVVGTDEVHELDNEVHEGEMVTVKTGAFHGLEAVVTRVMPGKDRVMLLMEFLGRQTMVEVCVTSVVRSGFHR
ncbi:MAG: hypothetical protein FJ405_09315 [Verrucomicrobia bacterium]|nr:hypothetical protein [Verrucomicrobiota bacterium]